MATSIEPKPKLNKMMQQDVQEIVNKFASILQPAVPEPARICSHCGKNKALNKFYSTRNPFAHNNRIGVCGPCINQIVNFRDLGEAQYFLIMMHYPFVETLWQSSVGEDLPVGHYLKAMNLGQYRNMLPASMQQIKTCTDDSIFSNELKILDTLLPEDKGMLLNKWGEEYDLLQCLKLEEYYENMVRDYDVKTQAHKDYVIKITKTSFAMNDALANKDFKTYKDLSGIFDSLMKSANLTESTRIKDNKKDLGYNAFGLLFETAEKKGFIPPYHVEENMDIVDKTIKNLKLWTKNLIEKETDLGVLFENAAKRVAEQEAAEERSEHDYDGITGIEEGDA